MVWEIHVERGRGGLLDADVGAGHAEDGGLLAADVGEGHAEDGTPTGLEEEM